MTQEYDVAIVGAGLGGLSTGSLLAQKGYKVLVLDKHNMPGGYATNFQRNSFSFDVSLHSFDGVMKGGNSYKVIEACGIEDKVEFIPNKTLYRYTSDDVELKVKHRDFEGYKQQLFNYFPEEKENLKRLFATAEKNFKHLSGFLYHRLPFWLRIVATPFFYRSLLKFEHDTVDQFFSRFTQNERLKAILAAQWSYYGLPPKDLAFGYFSYPFIDYLKYGGYTIEGGSQKLSNALVEVIKNHGGEVVLSSPVSSINVKNNKVVGLTTKRLGEVKARKIVTNVSPLSVLKLVNGNTFDDKFVDKVKSQKLSVSGFQVYLGLNCTFKELGIPEDEYIMFFSPSIPQVEQYKKIMKGEVMDGDTGWSINLFSNMDPTVVEEGKSSLGIFTLIGPVDWHSLPKMEYRRKKKALVDSLVARAEEKIPGLSKHIEVCEGGSPRTMTKFTGNPMGSIYGFAQNIEQSGLFRRFPQKYPVKGLYQVGAWTFPGGGFIGTMLSARVLVDRYF